MKIIYSLIFFAFAISSSSAQKSDLYEEWKLKFHKSKSYSSKLFFETNRNNMGLTKSDTMKLKNVNQGVDGLQHRKYEQFHNGIRVFGSAYTLHGDMKSIFHSSGYFIPNINIDTKIELDKSALSKQIQTLFIFQNKVSSKNNTCEINIEKVIMDKAFPEISDKIILVYQVDVYDKNRTIGTRYMVDAKTSAIITELELIHQHSVPAKGQSTVYGEVDIVVDSISAGNYVMVDSTRGTSIETYYNNLNNVVKDEDNYWELPDGKDYNVAVDVHYCSSKFYDMMLEKYDWNGLDDNGLSYKAVVYDNKKGDFVNAFWNGTNTTFGNGDCHRGPLTTLEVVGHEFMHGITDYTSDLIYKGESGAINESMSDVFGKMLEYTYHIEEFDWEIGESFLIDSYTQSFRSMSDPNSRNLPDTYKGSFWNDNAGVHTNSAVGNHFFYRLVEGGSGVTEKGEPFDFVGIGMELATKLIFDVQSNYLVSNSNYPDYYAYSLVSAKQLFGENSKEYQAVIEAWKVVGLPFEENIEKKDLRIDVDLNITNTCISDGFQSIHVKVTNTGKEIYPKGETFAIKLTLSGKKETYSYTFEEDFNIGEIMEITIDDFLYLDAEKNYYVSINLITTDNNSNNNKTFYYCKNKVILDNNLSLLEPYIQFKHCEGNVISTSARVKNASCNEFIPTKPIVINWVNAKNKSIFHQGEIKINVSMDSEDTDGIIEEVDYTGIDSFYIEMVSNDDVTPENNKSSLLIPPINKIIKSTYYTDFSEIVPFKNLYLSSLNNIRYLNQNGKDYLWTTALYENSSGSICQHAKDNIGSGRHGTNSGFSTCLDLTDNDSPFLRFSLTQYRSLNLDEFPINVQSNSAICRIEYIVNGEIIFKKTITNQEIGKEVTYLEDLPANTQGVLYFKFYNHLGNSSIFNPNFDNQLISELEIGQYNSTNDTSLQSNFVFPNPTGGILKLSMYNQFSDYELYDISGKRKIIYNNGNQIDLSHLATGIYFLKVYKNGKHVGTQKVILIK